MTKKELFQDVAKRINAMIDNVDPYNKDHVFKFCCNGLPFTNYTYNAKAFLLEWRTPRNKWEKSVYNGLFSSIGRQFEDMTKGGNKPERMTREEAEEKGFVWYDYEFQEEKRVIFM